MPVASLTELLRRTTLSLKSNYFLILVVQNKRASSYNS